MEKTEKMPSFEKNRVDNKVSCVVGDRAKKGKEARGGRVMVRFLGAEP